MYSVVGCPDCGALKIVEGRPETTGCPRCGRRTKFAKLRTFYRAEEADAAREVRARLLADRGGQREAYESLGSFAQQGEAGEDVGIDDREYLEGSGLDPDTVASAGERASTGHSRSRSKREVVTDALDELDRPTEAEVVAYAADEGVAASSVERTLEKLVRTGNVTVSDGRYRPL